MNYLFAKPHHIFIISSLLVENSTKIKKDVLRQTNWYLLFSIHEFHYMAMQKVKVNCDKFILYISMLYSTNDDMKTLIFCRSTKLMHFRIVICGCSDNVLKPSF